MLRKFFSGPTLVGATVPILDGNSKHVAHAWCKICNFLWGKNTSSVVSDLINCLKLIKFLREHLYLSYPLIWIPRVGALIVFNMCPPPYFCFWTIAWFFKYLVGRQTNFAHWVCRKKLSLKFKFHWYRWRHKNLPWSNEISYFTLRTEITCRLTKVSDPRVLVGSRPGI